MKIQVQVPDATWDAFRALAVSLNLPIGHFLDMVLRRLIEEDDMDFSSIPVKPPSHYMAAQKLSRGESWVFDRELGFRLKGAKSVTKVDEDPDDVWK